MPKLTRQQVDQIKALLDAGEELPEDYRFILFPGERRECELTYAGKERAEDILAGTWGVPLQAVKTFNVQKNKPAPDWTNRLIFGDNLQVMKRLLDDPQVKGRVKLIYIDPPFATRQEFQGKREQRAYQDKIIGAEFVEFLRKRLVFLRELLAPDGSIYVHLDTRKSHYIKTVMDEVFGEHRFMNEIVWRRSTAHSSAERYGAVHDTIFFYAMSQQKTWHPPLEPIDQKYVDRYFRYDDGDGKKYWLEDATGAGQGPPRRFGTQIIAPPPGRHFRWKQGKIDEYWEQGRFKFTSKGRIQFKRYLDDHEGKAIGDVWADIKRINQVAAERVQYPTQKPEALLERVISASSNPG